MIVQIQAIAIAWFLPFRVIHFYGSANKDARWLIDLKPPLVHPIGQSAALYHFVAKKKAMDLVKSLTFREAHATILSNPIKARERRYKR
jgi:hypothetical protein